jgi:hypothetical protein
LLTGIYKPTHTFISVFYLNAVGGNMSMVSGNILHYFCTLKRRTEQGKPFQVSKYIFKCEIKLHFVLVLLNQEFHFKFIF